jgi:uncharacterized membrane protein YphA (DoxX/SURF4 family)
MWQSLQISRLILRLSLAAVFLWFGIDKFFDPAYWLNTWVPNSVVSFGAVLHISSNAIVYGIGVMELLVGISLASNMFVDFFALVATVFLIAVSLFHGFGDILVRDIGIIGGLIALIVWPRVRGGSSIRFRQYL